MKRTQSGALKKDKPHFEERVNAMEASRLSDLQFSPLLGDEMSNVIYFPIKSQQMSGSLDDHDAYKLAFSKAETQVAGWHLLVAALRKLEAQLHQRELALHASGNSLEVFLAICALSGARQKLQDLIAEGELQANILELRLAKFDDARRYF